MPKPIKILHVLGRMVCGGAQMRTLDILRHIDRRQYQFHFCVLFDRPGELDEETRALGSEVYPMRVASVGFPRRFRRLLQEDQFDVVHSHVHYASGLLLRLAAKCGTPVRVAHFRTSDDGRDSGPARRTLRKLMRHWIDCYATNILAVNCASIAGTWGPDWRSDPRCQTIFNGLDPSIFEGGTDRDGVCREFGLPLDAPLCIHVGRMARPKNHPRLISIFAAVLGHQPTARLMIVGQRDDGIENRLRRRIAELGIRDHVVFCSMRRDVPRLLKAADLMIFPSLWEGLPGAVLEACAAGTPVVASDLPGIREIADRLPNVRCLSLDLPNGQWAQTISQILSHLPTDAQRCNAHRAFAASDFTIGRCTEKMCRVWQGLAPELTVGGAAGG